MKRPSSAVENDGANSEQRPRLGLKHHKLHHVQDGTHQLLNSPQDRSIVQSELTRAICSTLHYIGFDGATKNALESFNGVLQEYIEHFVYRLKHSMQHSRRTRPIPHDFINALATFSLAPSSFNTDLSLPTPSAATLQPLVQLEGPDFDDLFKDRQLTLTTRSASSQDSSPRGQHIPKHFPQLPGTHTYRNTPLESSLETDPHKIREKATEDGNQAEQALRKLMAASKAGRAQMLKSRAESDDRWKQEDEMFREAMESLGEEHRRRKALAKASNATDGLSGDTAMIENVNEIEEEVDEREREQGVAVNYDRVYWRAGGRGHAL